MGRRQAELDALMTVVEERRLLHERLIGDLRRELEGVRDRYEALLRELAGIKDEPMARTLGYGDLKPGERQAKLTPTTGERPGWAEPDNEAFWSGDGLSSSLDDDPLDIEELVYLPADVDPYPEPLPETEGRDRAMGIAPGEDPFQGLVGLDPNA